MIFAFNNHLRPNIGLPQGSLWEVGATTRPDGREKKEEKKGSNHPLTPLDGPLGARAVIPSGW